MAWIEIAFFISITIRSRSPPTWVAWVEILSRESIEMNLFVAAYTGGVGKTNTADIKQKRPILAAQDRANA